MSTVHTKIRARVVSDVSQITAFEAEQALGTVSSALRDLRNVEKKTRSHLKNLVPAMLDQTEYDLGRRAYVNVYAEFAIALDDGEASQGINSITYFYNERTEFVKMSDRLYKRGKEVIPYPRRMEFPEGSGLEISNLDVQSGPSAKLGIRLGISDPSKFTGKYMPQKRTWVRVSASNFRQALTMKGRIGDVDFMRHMFDIVRVNGRSSITERKFERAWLTAPQPSVMGD